MKTNIFWRKRQCKWDLIIDIAVIVIPRLQQLSCVQKPSKDLKQRVFLRTNHIYDAVGTMPDKQITYSLQVKDFQTAWPLPKVITVWRKMNLSRVAVGAQLAEQSLQTPEVQSSNPVTGQNLYWTFDHCQLYWKDENKEKEAGKIADFLHFDTNCISLLPSQKYLHTRWPYYLTTYLGSPIL